MPRGDGYFKNTIIFGVDDSSVVHTDNRIKDILNLGKGQTDGLDDTAITAEITFSINFTEEQSKFCSNIQICV